MAWAATVTSHATQMLLLWAETLTSPVCCARASDGARAAQGAESTAAAASVATNLRTIFPSLRDGLCPGLPRARGEGPQPACPRARPVRAPGVRFAYGSRNASGDLGSFLAGSRCSAAT